MELTSTSVNFLKKNFAFCRAKNRINERREKLPSQVSCSSFPDIKEILLFFCGVCCEKMKKNAKT